MNTRELIEAAKNKKITIQQINEQREIILEVNTKFMNRVYSL